MALGSAAAWAVGVILARQLGAHLPPLTLNLLKNGLVLVVLAPIALLLHAGDWPVLPARDVAIVLASGVIGIALADTLYFRALNELGAGRMGIIGNLYSPLVLLLGFVFLDERLGGAQWLGFALVAMGVLLVSRPPGEWRTHPQHTARGVLLGLLAIALMAVAIVMVKRTLETQPLLWVTLLRLLGAVAGLLLVAALPAMRRRMQFVAADVPWHRLLLAAIIGQGLSMVLWLGGYKYTSASVAAILNECASVFLVVLAALWLREPLGRRAFVGVLLTFSGIACMLLGRATP
ncbi:DMT family transporter [Pseudoxanthomonas sp. PXM02]|uniref:DMT family transporter n=1 Tax=Pseudoxanthomonas sp. PXM02 TaxID=2769294 RepID=UPI001781B6BC|nr:DMT family transporter [Pseudoxanthomonas sp. PXM02]MBD9479364.1 DMT family transporter [Pseudoxanthomonas sp. PXM02]